MEITLIYPHQLFAKHPAIQPHREVWLIEDPLFFGNDPQWPTSMHQQKLVIHRASMKAYASELEMAGNIVRYIENPSGSLMHSGHVLEASLPKELRCLHLVDPSDHVLKNRIERFADQKNIPIKWYSSPNFLSLEEFLTVHLATKKKPFMAKFYEAQRRQMNILVEKDNSPVGGKWSFDSENRVKLPKKHVPPAEPRCRSNHFTIEAIDYVSKKFPDNLGTCKNFRWPVTRLDAEAWLEQFIEDRFENFGIYEDAISKEHPYIYHAAITPMLNIGLLDPQQVVDRLLQKASSCKNIPMNSLEGFIRQVIGWREFMHGIYRHRGTEIRNGNFWEFHRPIPQSFYDATTGIEPVDRVIRQLLDDGYCHHIERLMVLGNFMVLCRIHPNDVYRWFMEMFIDSYDWVMVPNVYGMSQFADGGTFTTKPYISGSNYILKMSDESKGPWCEIWDGLFWSFIGDYTPFFLKNPRLSMMARNWEKQSPEKQAAHRRAADHFLANLK
jgi:deoxyribodipyrimidine photolyase-related protein